ncbi:MAG: hypothetical protein ACREVR_20715, partial [Burkholderiales bacterium]
MSGAPGLHNPERLRGQRVRVPRCIPHAPVSALAASLPAREHVHPRPPALVCLLVARTLAARALLVGTPLPPPP